MAQSIEAYIECNSNDVEKWITKLSGLYIQQLLIDPDDRSSVNSQRVLDHAGRIHKLIEVFYHYDLIESAMIQYAPYDRYAGRSGKDTYNFKVNHKVFLKMAKKYGKKYNFKVEAPSATTDRVHSYPSVKSISHEGIIHYYFHKDQYEIFDNDENPVDNYGVKSKSSTRVIRIYPKNLESKAERAVFEAALERYYTSNIDKAIEMMYGFLPEVLTHRPEHTRWDDGKETLKGMSVDRCNMLGLDFIEKEEVKKRLDKAKRLKLYAEACIRDLEQLNKVVPKNNETFRKKLFKKAEPELALQAPLMLNDPDGKARELANLLLKGSNKGLL